MNRPRVTAALLLTAIGLVLTAAAILAGGTGEGMEAPPTRWVAFDLDDLEKMRREAESPWLPFLQTDSVRTGLYVLAAGAEDGQSPHKEDEVYFVIRGKAVLRVDGEDRPVAAGTVIYVAREIEHHFHSIEEELQVLVVFAENGS